MQKQYTFRDGSRYAAKLAPVVGAVIEGLSEQHGGTVNAEHVVAEAVQAGSPLHQFFEWDDTKAATEHRLEQARLLLRSIVIRVVDDGSDVTMRAFFNIQPLTDDDERAYIPAIRVMTDGEMRQQLVSRALAEAESWQQRYGHLDELDRVFAAIAAAKARALAASKRKKQRKTA